MKILKPLDLLSLPAKTIHLCLVELNLLSLETEL